ncbi:hypothetical protein NLG97_g2268 [Lecanicillium saksenae]|uniref:Uncharacterized protein n=1 Tax=Lecanicillium saksenae TaxID=468837 RepID=A0ACC1R2T7_9HYPO|nr:hypothetical protein NLG97_g2268 [Lecanicillium saksenae]
MSSFASFAGFGTAANPENHIAFYLIANALWAHTLSSSRALKFLLGIDNHVNPRAYLDKFGHRAVLEGKITQDQLDMVKRNESAHANSMEHYPIFATALVLAQVAGLPARDINFAGFAYTAFRLAFWLNYMLSKRMGQAALRPVFWWGSNVGWCSRSPRPRRGPKLETLDAATRSQEQWQPLYRHLGVEVPVVEDPKIDEMVVMPFLRVNDLAGFQAKLHQAAMEWATEANRPVYAPFFSAMGCSCAVVLGCFGAAYATAKSSLGIISAGVLHPDTLVKNLVPVIMASVIAIFGLIVSVIITGDMKAEVPLSMAFSQLGAGLTVGLAGLAAGMAIGIIGDAGARASAQQPRLYVGMVLILIFAEALGLYGLIIALTLNAKGRASAPAC